MKIRLKYIGRTYEAEAKMLEEAVAKIKISGSTKLVSLLTINGKEKILNGSITNRLFGQVSNVAREIAIKQIKQMFT